MSPIPDSLRHQNEGYPSVCSSSNAGFDCVITLEEALTQAQDS